MRGAVFWSAAHPIMVVARMKRLDVRQLLPLERILAADPHRLPRSAIEIGDRPALLVADDAHPLGPQQAQLLRNVAVVGDQLDIGVAVKQQVCGYALQEAVGLDQSDRAFVALYRIDRQPAEHPRDQAYRTLPNGVALINLQKLIGI